MLPTHRWYHGPHPVDNFGGVKCVSEWKLPTDTYPGGLDQLRSDYNAPFLLYGPYFCTKNQWDQVLVPEGMPFPLITNSPLAVSTH
jgi:hypothetical protein